MDVVFAGGVSLCASALWMSGWNLCKLGRVPFSHSSPSRKRRPKFPGACGFEPVRSWDNYSHFRTLVLVPGAIKHCVAVIYPQHARGIPRAILAVRDKSYGHSKTL